VLSRDDDRLQIRLETGAPRTNSRLKDCMPTKATNPAIAKCYLDALRLQLDAPRAGGITEARALGRDAMAAGCDTLELAQIHERALTALAPEYDFAKIRNGLQRRTSRFFTEVLVPLEGAHRTTRESLAESRQSTEILRQNSAALAKSNRTLTRELARHRAREKAQKSDIKRNGQLLAQSRIMQAKLRSSNHQILRAQENERRKISQELHDEVVQTLVGINVHLATLGRAAAIGTRSLQTKIASIQQLVEKSVSAVHQFARDLSPAMLDDLGLIPALQALMKTMAARKKIRIQLNAFAGVEAMEEIRRIVLYRVVQEALTNVTRHAKASQVTVKIHELGNTIRTEVHDNGKSFRVDRVLESTTTKRLGLLCMRERVEMVGGTLNIESAPGYGTTVRVGIPFSAKEDL